MRVIVCGGRDVGRTNRISIPFDAAQDITRASAERKFVSDKLDELHTEKKFCKIIGGNEGGAERLGTHWAAIKRIPVEIVYRRSRRETLIERNLRMLRQSEPELIVAFGPGQTTRVLLDEAQKIGVPIIEIVISEL